MKMQGPLFEIQEIGASEAPSAVYFYLCIALWLSSPMFLFPI